MNNYNLVSESLILLESLRIMEIVSNVPIVNKKELISISKPADILITKIPNSIYIKGTKLRQFISKASQKIQGIPFTSSKLIIDQKKIIGYGLPKKSATRNNFVTYSYPVYSRLLHNACLVRHNNISDQKSKKIIEYALKRENIEYAFSHVWKTLWNRLWREQILQFLRHGENVDKKIARDYSEPLICSSIIGMAYLNAGLKLGTDIKNVMNIWPKDFLYSKNFQIIARIGDI